MCYINDITTNISSKLKLYADDVLIYNTINSEADCTNLQSGLNTLQDWALTWQMHFNSSKCEFLRVTNRKKIIEFQYCIQGDIIREVQNARYLGITINNKLSWSNHVHNVTSKANSVIGFLRRNFHQCPIQTKSALYSSLVRPILEYAVTVWAPHHQSDIHRLEAVQRRAATFVMNCFDRYQSVSDMLSGLNWPTLAKRRDHFKITMLYKIIHNIVHVHLDLPFTYSNLINYTRGHVLKIQQPTTRIDSYLNSFFPSAIKLWNSLPANVIDSSKLDDFKYKLSNL